MQVDGDVHPVPTDVSGKTLSPLRAAKPVAASATQSTPPAVKGRTPVATRASVTRVAVTEQQPQLRRSERVGGAAAAVVAAAAAVQGNGVAAEQAKQARVRRAVAQVQAQQSRQPTRPLPPSAPRAGALQQLKGAVKGKATDVAALQQQQQRQRQLRHHQDAQQHAHQEVTARQQRLQAQHDDEQQRQKQSLQQRQYGHDLLMHQQSGFVPQSHGFSASAAAQQPATASQAVQHHNEQGFGFSSQTANSSAQTQYVTEAQRQYLQELSMPARSFARITAQQQQQQQRTRQRANVLDEAADAAAGLTALPGAVNGMHTGLASSAAGQPSNSASPTALGMAGAQGARYANVVNATAAASLQQQHASVRVSPQLETYGQNPNETGEERKRRLARERQRRRRRRLKGEIDGKSEGDDIQRPSEPSARHMATGAGLANATLALPAQGMQSHGQGQMGSAVATQFESGALGTNSAMQAGLQPLHVTGVSASQDDLNNAAANRGGFSAHTLGVGGATGPLTSSGVVANMDLQRMASTDAEVKEMPVQRETAEMRKRRLARDRQRRRRNRLKRSKLGLEPIEKSPTSSQGLKHGGDGSTGRLVENADQRVASDLDRRAMVTEGGGDSERMPIGSPGSTVFGGRADVGQSLGFTDQGRGMRGNASMADGMGINFTAGSNGLNLQMQVGNIGSGVQSSGGGLMHWSQGFDSETSARFAVEGAVSAFRAQLSNLNPTGRTYVLQQGMMMLSGSDDAARIF